MKRLMAIAAVLLASTAANAGDSYTFDVGGHTVHIDAPRHCRSTACVSVSVPGVYEPGPKRTTRALAKADREQVVKDQSQIDAPPKVAAPAEPPPGPAAAARVETPAVPAAAAPVVQAAPAPQPMREAATQPAPVVPAPVARPAAAATVVATAPVAAAVQKHQTPAAARPANSPLGVWLTEEKEGKVRIEPCGANLCGYSVNAQTDTNGDKVLINMKPAADGKWSGRIFDPNSGSTYDSTIALNSPDSLRVQGCAFGGMFCGGQTWSRVN